MKASLKGYLETYADEQHSSHYRQQWALANLKVVEQLNDYIGQTILISLNRDYEDGTLEIMFSEYFEDINDDEWFLDMCMYIE